MLQAETDKLQFDHPATISTHTGR